MERVVPSIVLFSAIHYKGLEDGPDFHYALNFNSLGYLAANLNGKSMEPTDDANRDAKWRLLMSELGIYQCDEFEVMVVEFLESGRFDLSRLTPIIDRYVLEKRSMEAREKANQFLKNAFWNHRIDNTQLLEMARELPAIAGLLDPYVCSELYVELKGIPGAVDIGQAIIDGWVKAFRGQDHIGVNYEDPFSRPLHSDIVEVFAEVSARTQKRTTVLDACMFVFENGAWGTKQEVALKGASVADFESTIRGLEIDKLRPFMRKMMGMRLQRQVYDPHFGTATERFVEACRVIANDPTSSRLAGLIKRLFKNTPIAVDVLPNHADATTSTANTSSSETTASHL